MIDPKNVAIVTDSTRDPMAKAIVPGQPPGYPVVVCLEHAAGMRPGSDSRWPWEDPHERGLAGPEFTSIGRDMAQ